MNTEIDQLKNTERIVIENKPYEQNDPVVVIVLKDNEDEVVTFATQESLYKLLKRTYASKTL